MNTAEELNPLHYQCENYLNVMEEFSALMPLIYQEVDIYPENPEPNFNHDEMIQLEELGILQFVTARDHQNNLVGIHASIVRPDMYYAHILTGFVMFYYVHPNFRGGGNGTNMFVFADNQFKEKGVERIFMSRKIYINNEKMFDKLGYNHIEANYTKAVH